MANFEKVQCILDKTFEPFPKDIKQQLRASFVKQYESPMTDLVEKVVGKRFTDEEIRFVQFMPKEDQIQYYVLLLKSPPFGSTKSHPQYNVQRSFLPMFYLIHAQSWSFVQEFILHVNVVFL